MKPSTTNLVAQAEGLQNTISERVLPGIEAAIKVIGDVVVQSDTIQGVASIRAAAQNLDGFSQALHASADLLEAAHKEGSAIAVMFNLRRLSGIAEGLQVHAGALQRHGPAIKSAVAAAILAERDTDIEFDPESGGLIAKVVPTGSF